MKQREKMKDKLCLTSGIVSTTVGFYFIMLFLMGNQFNPCTTIALEKKISHEVENIRLGMSLSDISKEHNLQEKKIVK